ncbi:MAG: class I SAM-dependent methyltransferase [Phycisphaerales bacterium]|nr:MAG: class I SAM-dependent methyltransferase [Phycisphaerales bacterium]
MMHERVAKAISELERFIGTVDDALAIPREAGEFVHALILGCGAKHGVEIGTSYGYSGLWIASALRENGGTLITIDHDPRKSETARDYFDSGGLTACVDVRTGRAADVLESLTGPIDFVLNDADKESCIRYVELVAEKLSDRAVVLTDNTIDLADRLAEFVAWIRQRDDFYSTTVPVGNGMELSIKQTVRQKREPVPRYS